MTDYLTAIKATAPDADNDHERMLWTKAACKALGEVLWDKLQRNGLTDIRDITMDAGIGLAMVYGEIVAVVSKELDAKARKP